MKTSHILTSLGLIAVTATANGQNLLDGDFNAISTGNYAPSTPMGAWFVDGSASGTIISGLGISGSSCLVFEDVYDTNPTTSIISQVVTGLVPGQVYAVTFFTSGSSGFLSPDDGVDVNVSISINGTDDIFGYKAYYSSGENPGMGTNPWILRTVEFTADDISEQIVLSGSNPGYSVSMIDSVSIAAIPEFSSSGTILGAIALLVFSLKRTRNKNLA